MPKGLKPPSAPFKEARSQAATPGAEPFGFGTPRGVLSKSAVTLGGAAERD
jgi:hypothetical protein